jgi:hypothetical protein
MLAGSQRHLVRVELPTYDETGCYLPPGPKCTAFPRPDEFRLQNEYIYSIENQKLELECKLSSMNSINIHPNKLVYDHDSP